MKEVKVEFKVFEQKNLRPEDYFLPPEVAEVLDATKETILNPNQPYSTKRKWFSRQANVRFSHHLLKANNKEWVVVDNTPKGKGAFGKVTSSKFKVVVTPTKAKVVPEKTVIKEQNITHEEDPQEKLQSVIAEAKHQKHHSTRVYGVISHHNTIFTVTEDCGTSLDKLLPFPASYSFDKRLMIAMAICNDMLLLKQTEQIHRDLKPANICIKEENGVIKLKYIDFGLAAHSDSKENKVLSGTPAFMAPECETKGTSYATDMYALAGILAAIFNAKDIFKYKEQAYNIRHNYSDMFKAKFCLDEIFTGFPIPTDVDKNLLADMRALIEDLQNDDSDKRPSIELVNKFLVSIPSRRAEYKKYTDAWTDLQQQYFRLITSYENLGLTGLSHFITTIKSPAPNMSQKNPFMHFIWQKQHQLTSCFASLTPPKSHLAISKLMLKHNVTNSDYDEYEVFPNVAKISEEIASQQNYLKQFSTTFAKFSQPFMQKDKFQNTNSSGLLRIMRVINSNACPLEKMAQINKIAKAKIQPGFANWYSHSHLFGKGRHKNVDTLYQRLGNIDTKCFNDDRLAAKELNEITDYIASNTFTH